MGRAPEVIRGLEEQRTPVVITLRGEAKTILQDMATYEETQETLALLKILALTNKRVEEGKIRPAREAFSRIRKRVKAWTRDMPFEVLLSEDAERDILDIHRYIAQHDGADKANLCFDQFRAC
jgi:PHD/YefM family antitoxin component YafN of YafNO toxin-antitoxin module